MDEKDLSLGPSPEQSFQDQEQMQQYVQMAEQRPEQQATQSEYGVVENSSQVFNNAVMNGPQDKTKKKKIMIWVLASILCIGIIAAAVFILISSLSSSDKNDIDNNPDKQNGNLVAASFDNVKQYCIKNDIPYDANTDYKGAAYLTCQLSSYDKDYRGVYSIQYVEYPYNVLTDDEASRTFDEAKSYFSVLADGDNYLKMYSKSSYGGVEIAEYIVILDNKCMYLTASGVDAAEDGLNEMGYSGWVKADANDETKSGMLGAQVDSLRESQFMTQRRNDIAIMSVAIVNFQTNTGGRLPEGPIYWGGTEILSDCGGNVACSLVKDYVNSSDTSNNTFIDPEGDPYSVFITENLAQNDTITTSFGNSNSELVFDSEKGGYTIGGQAPLEEHVIYIVPGSRCDDDIAVKLSNKNTYSILYQIGSSQVMCSS